MVEPTSPTWDPQLSELVSFDNGEAWLTPYFVYGTNAALPLLVAGVFFFHAMVLRRRRSLALRAEASAVEPSTEGAAVVLGTVHDADGGGPPVEVTITQTGITRAVKNKYGRSTGWRTKWIEITRERKARAFVVRTAAGTDVRVVPDDQVKLLDDLEPGSRDGTQRILVAKLEDGEQVYAFGTLSQELDARAPAGYRTSGKSWVLRPPRGGSMMLSVRAMSARFSEAARVRVAAARVLLGFVLLVQAITTPYHVALWRGHAEPAEVVKLASETVRVKNGTETRYWLTFRRISTGAEFTDRISEDDRHLFTPGRILPIHVVRFLGDDRVTLGAGATANAGLSLVPMLLSFVLVGACAAFVRSARLWYERNAVVQDEPDEDPNRERAA